jgi:hypothetical protein
VDEHRSLYEPHTLPAASTGHPTPSRSPPRSSSPPVAPRQSSQSQPLHFFSPRPAGNPFATATRHIPLRPPRPARPARPARPPRPSPVRPSFSPLSSTRPFTPRPSFSPLSSSILESIGVAHRGSEDLVLAYNDPTGDNDDYDDDLREDEDIHQPDPAAGERDGSFRDGSSDPCTARRVHHEGNNRAHQHTDSGEEDWVYEFVSERSAPTSEDEDEDNEQPPPDLQHTINKLFAFVQGDVGAYTEDQHREHRRQHMAIVADDDHHGLNDIFLDPSSIRVLASSDMLTSDQLARFCASQSHAIAVCVLWHFFPASSSPVCLFTLGRGLGATTPTGI